MLMIEMLPAECGDCFWIEYGNPDAVRRLLIDGGTCPTYEALHNRIEALPPDDRIFELLVVTHIDADHIDGIVRLLQNRQLGAHFNDIWFNGWRHVNGLLDETLGPIQGEYLSAQIAHKMLPWNEAFGNQAVVVQSDLRLPRIQLAGELVLTLLSPTYDKLKRLRDAWEEVVTEVEKDYPDPDSTADWFRRLDLDSRYRSDDFLGDTPRPDVARLLEEQFTPDSSATNGSSIAFLLEFQGTCCLFGGDAHSTVLENSVRTYLAEEGLSVLRLDMLKVPHHGSKANISMGMLRLLQCKQFLISTNGQRFNHPDPEAIARIVAHSDFDKDLVFNYDVEHTRIWDDLQLAQEYHYGTQFPVVGTEGIFVKV
jgi:hypothetical protein